MLSLVFLACAGLLLLSVVHGGEVEIGACSNGRRAPKAPTKAEAEGCVKTDADNCLLTFGQSKDISLAFDGTRGFKRATSLILTVEAQDPDMKELDGSWIALETIELCKEQADLKLNGQAGCVKRSRRNMLTYKLKVPDLDLGSISNVDIRVKLVASGTYKGKNGQERKFERAVFCGLTVVDVEDESDPF